MAWGGQFSPCPTIRIFLADKNISFTKGYTPWNKGKRIRTGPRKHTKESKRLMSLSRKGKPIMRMTELHKANLSRALSIVSKRPETRRKRSLAKMGQRNPMWLSDRSKFSYPDSFSDKLRAYIRERDDNRCRLCLRTSVRLDTHHIDYNKMNSDERNLITLCISCHAKTNYNRNFWKNLLGTLLN